MKIGIFAGSFCPVTVGHVDAIRRAAKLVDKLYVVVGVNIAKKYVMPDEARLQSVVAATSDIPNVECALHKGLLVDYARKVGATVMIKVVRNATETDEVLTLVDINRDMWEGETVFIAADRNLRHVSSSLVRELALLGKDDYSAYVPQAALPIVKKYFG